MKCRWTCLPLLLALLGAANAFAQPQAGSATANETPVPFWESEANIAKPPDLPEIGRWMLTGQGVASDWLGEIYEGKTLREPINVIVVDEGASSADDAKARLQAAAAKAGYPIRFGHSTGYLGYIGGQLYPQLPKGWDDAFSNDIFEVNNNHGRIFGPHKAGDAYVFTAAFSREEVDPFGSPKHRFASFNRARDDFTQRLNRNTPYKVSGFIDLGNALVGDPSFTTGDHDGMAVLVRVGP